MSELALRCQCGALQGTTVDLRRGETNRVVCLCDDCQAFVRWLGRDDLLDPYGGTDIVQFWPARVRFTQGMDQLRLVRLSASGLCRWFTACCRTPAGNMLSSPRAPFVGLPARMIADGDGPPLETVLGEPIAHIHGRFSPGGCPPHAQPRASAGVLLRTGGFLLRGWLGGRAAPSPYFVDGRPRVAAQVLTTAERAALGPAAA